MDRLALLGEDPLLGRLGQLVELVAGLAVVLDGVLEVLAVGGRLQQREQCPDGVADVADETEVEGHATTEVLTAQVDLDEGRALRVELAVREVGAEHQHGVGLLHRPVPGREAEQPGQADVEGVVPLDLLLGAKGVHHRCRETVREREDVVLGASGAGPDEQGRALGGAEQLRGAVELVGCGDDAGPAALDDGDPLVDGLGLGDLAGDHEDRDAALLDGGAHGRLQHARHLRRVGDHLAVDAALLEEVLRVGLLEVPAADLRARDLRGDRQDRHPAALGVEEAVDQVQVARAAAAEDDGELTGQLGVGGGREGCRLLVADQAPGDGPVASHGLGEAVERVPRHPVGAGHPVGPERGDDVVCDRAHGDS